MTDFLHRDLTLFELSCVQDVVLFDTWRAQELAGGAGEPAPELAQLTAILRAASGRPAPLPTRYWVHPHLGYLFSCMRLGYSPRVWPPAVLAGMRELYT